MSSTPHASPSSSCCFSLFSHIPSIRSRVDWLDSARNGEEFDDDTSNSFTATTTTTCRSADEYETLTKDDTKKNSHSSIAKDEAKGSYIDSKNDIETKHVVLLEIVGAMGLETKQRRRVDPYCVVRVCDSSTNNTKDKFRTIHRTDTIHNDGNPIWTVQTKSLCIVELPSVTEPSLGNCSTSSATTDDTGCLLIDIYHGNSQLDGLTAPLMDFVTSTTVVTDKVIPSQLRIPQQQPLSLGRVKIPFEEILQCCIKQRFKRSDSRNDANMAERIEYPLQAAQLITGKPQSILEQASIALRFCFATERDVSFLNKLSQSQTAVRESNDHRNTTMLSNLSTALMWQLNSRSKDGTTQDAADINFRYINRKSLTMAYKRKGPDGIEQFRVLPYPDPKRIEATTWMSAVEMERAAQAPSTKWINVGGGNLGIVHCEIIGCNDLPQMDATDFSSTDPVVAIAFEDNFVRTDIIWDQQHPRWMPWTTRAYRFHIRHPASILCISVLDCDENMFDKHDPIGRVVVQPSCFKPNLTYTLHYPLQDDPSEEPTSDNTLITGVNDEENNAPNIETIDSQKILTQRTDGGKSARGTIVVRIRIEWVDECMAMKMYYKAPPRFIVNVDNEKSYEALTYTTRGVGYMHNVSIKSVKLLAREVMEYGGRFCFTMDVLMEILLWRGRCHITKSTSIWFPIHSVVLFVGALTLVERPDWIVPISLYGIAWVLLSVNYYASSHPNPWLRTPPYTETICMTVFGRRTVLPVSSKSNNAYDRMASIASYQGSSEAMRQEKLDELKAARMSALISGTITFLSKVYYIYSKTGNKAIKITTDRTNKWNILSSKLKYIHMFLLYMCQYLRLGRNFTSWKSNYTAVVTSYCLIIATIWCIFPVSTIVHWMIRIGVVVFLGPWMKFLDIRYVHRWYSTKEELLARISNGDYRVHESDVPDFDSLLQNKTFRSMIHLGRVKAEELYKLRDMRQLLFGQFSELIPFVDNSRYPNIPLPQSTATRTNEWKSVESTVISYHVPGQLLFGDMIHVIDGPVTKLKEGVSVK